MNYKITFKLSTVDRELFWVYDFNPGLKNNKNYMQVTKCDVCKKEIKDYKEEVKIIAPNTFAMIALCLDCGKPVLRFLRSHSLVKSSKKSKK